MLILGWKCSGDFPENVKKAIIIVAPHTSNWDFFAGFFMMLATGLKASWIGKNSIFVFPINQFLRFFGGIPVDRSVSTGVVDQIVQIIKDHEKIVFALSPEGTRKKVERWRTGFYNIAKKAEIPIIPIYLDYKTKTIGFAEIFWPQGDLESDIEKLKVIFSDVTPKRPECF